MAEDDTYARGYATSRTLDPALRFDYEPLFDLLRSWNEWRGERAMPTRSDFAPTDLKGHLGWVALIDVQHDPVRFRFRLIGADIATGLSRDSSGKYLDDVYGPEFYETSIGSYRWILEYGKPLRAFGTMVHAKRGPVRFESLDLPFSSDGRTIDMIMKRVRFSRMNNLDQNS